MKDELRILALIKSRFLWSSNGPVVRGGYILTIITNIYIYINL